ncbi:MAG: MCE family protein [Verrucomicrobia bacterium]|nr:MCE family protein [Verrucomicrobiota bacterium]
MAKPRYEIKVGLFVLFCLAVVGLLVVSFSKGFSLVKSTYEIKLRTTDVGGIKSRATVLMAGVHIGNVTKIKLMPDGKSAVLTLKIEDQYSIHRDANFLIEQAGLLGDQYVSIVPRENKGPMIQDGEEVSVAAATDFKMMLASAAGLITRLDEIATTMQTAVGRVDKLLLNESNLASLSDSVANIRDVSRRATNALAGVERTVDGANALVRDNSAGVALAVSNLTQFSAELKRAGGEINGIVGDNRADIHRAVQNLNDATSSAKDLLADVQAGKGLVGCLLRDDDLKREMHQVVTDLAVLSSNLSHYGLLYKPKAPRTTSGTSPSLQRGRTPN